MPYDLETVRSCFPALAETDNGQPRIYFDNPAGTQVPQMVVDRMSECLLQQNANLGGNFRTSKLADAVVMGARSAMADLLNAESTDEIVFGQNMTTLTLHIGRSIGRTLSAGDEIVLSRMDHDANVNPWLMLARDLGLKVRWLSFDPRAFEFDLGQLDELLNSRTRLVCVGGASNLIGTINDIGEISRRARDVGALSYIDAVQSVPHVATDVQAIGCDFLVCSAYKFFGPHQGILWGRREALELLTPYKARPAPDELPWCFETGTQSHEGMAGVTAAVDYFAWIGASMSQEHYDDYPNFEGRRKYVHAAMDCLFDYEKSLCEQLITGLQALPGVTVQGLSGAEAMDRRVPTVSITHESLHPASIAKELAKQNIFVWSGHNYALEAARTLAIDDRGGAVRIGPVHYNSSDEINVLLDALATIMT
jgi:cysteine desulfurase family protein (TIGR01976 family)